jgi:integrase
MKFARPPSGNHHGEQEAPRRGRQLYTRGDSARVFTSPDNAPYTRRAIGRVFRRAARAAGLKDFHFHDLRHHGATVALNRGFTSAVVQALGGWKTERMMKRYGHITDATLRAAAEAVSGADRNGTHARRHQ